MSEHDVRMEPTETGHRAMCPCGWQQRFVGPTVDAFFEMLATVEQHAPTTEGAVQGSAGE